MEIPISVMERYIRYKIYIIEGLPPMPPTPKTRGGMALRGESTEGSFESTDTLRDLALWIHTLRTKMKSMSQLLG